MRARKIYARFDTGYLFIMTSLLLYALSFSRCKRLGALSRSSSSVTQKCVSLDTIVSLEVVPLASAVRMRLGISRIESSAVAK